MPFGGFAAYLMLSETLLSRELRSRHAALTNDIRALTGPASDSLIATLSADNRPPFRIGASINGFPPVAGNRARLLPDAEATRQAILADIDAATESVSLLYYIWLTDRTGTDIARALIRAARRGVTCRVMADYLGSRTLLKSPLWAEMAQAGVETRIAMPPETVLGLPVLTRLDLRNHRKITLIDGRIAYAGSQNCADPEFAPKRKYGPWIDLMLRLEGPVVNQITLIFAGDWCLAGPGSPADFPLVAAPHPGGFIAQARATGPLERPDSAPQMFCTLFERAQDELIISTPYFVPDAPVLMALKSAARRGARVSLILPRRNDSPVVQAASRGNYHTLLRAGVRLFEHGPGLLHAKTLTIDGELAFLGSSNLDMRSFDLNFESDILIHDPATAQAIRARQQAYIAQSDEVTLDSVRAWPAPRRAWNNLVATLGPVL